MSPVSTANGKGSASGGAITPPHNLDAEQSVLGAILLSDRSLYALVIEEGLRAEDFYRERDPGSARAENRQTQRPYAGSDQRRRHLHGRGRGGRWRDRHDQDDGGRKEIDGPAGARPDARETHHGKIRRSRVRTCVRVA